MLKETQGEINTAPRRGEERVMFGMGTVVDGWGWEMWERRARTRFPPAESPVSMILLGSILSVFKT